MSVSVSYLSRVRSTETLTNNVPAAASDASITHDGYDSSATLNGTSTPPATECAYFSKALSAGAGTIDLTAIPGANNRTIDGTGLKVQIARFKNPSTNANNITVTFGASNAYLLAGAAWKAILAPGQEVMYFGNDATPDVDSTHKNIDISGTGTQALQVSLVLG